jgi:hypothetical protein
MSALGGFQPVLIAGGRGATDGCPTADVLVLYGAGLPRGDDDQEELLDGWTLATLDDHVAGCPTCRAQADETSDVVGVLRAQPLDAPDAEFWDDLTDGVMRTVAGAERGSGLRDNVVQLRPVPGAPEPDVVDPTLRRFAWALAVAVAFAVGLGVWLERDPVEEAPLPGALVEESSPEPVESLPDREHALAVAAELGISADPLDLSDAADADVVASDISLGGTPLEAASLAWLVDGLAAADMELLDVSLPTTDPLFDLIALDDSDLAEVLRSLES